MADPPLDPKRMRDSLVRCREKEKAADDLRREADALDMQAAFVRQRWGLPARSEGKDDQWLNSTEK